MRGAAEGHLTADKEGHKDHNIVVCYLSAKEFEYKYWNSMIMCAATDKKNN